MNKIKIDISLDQLNKVNETFTLLSQPSMKSRKANVTISVIRVVAKKLLKKAIDKIGATKKFTVALSYHEAHYLERYLITYCTIFNSQAIQNIIDKLNQKLA
jgi:hypothetical protein